MLSDAALLGISFVVSYLSSSCLCYIRDRHSRNFNVHQYQKIFTLCILNACVLAPLILISFVTTFPLNSQAKWYSAIWRLPLAYVLADFFFWCAHRASHVPCFYRFHRVHHEYHFPVGAGAFYMHPVDFLFGNLLPYVMGFYFSGLNIIMAMLLLIAGVCNTVLRAHGSFSEMSPHKWHHYFGNVNYSSGQAGFDRIFGTLPDSERLKKAIMSDSRIRKYSAITKTSASGAQVHSAAALPAVAATRKKISRRNIKLHSVHHRIFNS